MNIGVRNSVGFFTCDVFCWIWGNFVEFGQTLHICEVFDRIPHVWPIKSDITFDIHILYEFDGFLPHMCSISLNYSHNRSSRLNMELSANICVKNSVGFFTCDEFCRICHNCDELGLIVHICDVFDRVPHVWYIQWDILHVIFSANIGVRNSVGIFTCDVFCRIYHDCDEFGGKIFTAMKNSMELLYCYIWSDVKQATHFRWI